MRLEPREFAYWPEDGSDMGLLFCVTESGEHATAIVDGDYLRFMIESMGTGALKDLVLPETKVMPMHLPYGPTTRHHPPRSKADAANSAG